MGSCARCKGSSRPRWQDWVALAVLAGSILLLSAYDARAEVYHSKESALRLAFPDADEVRSQRLILTDAQAARVEALARTSLPSRLVNVYVGQEKGEVTGYAFIETHRVRSLPETVLVVLDAQGRNRGVHLLAFHEPAEYEPSGRWLAQFEGRRLDDDLALKRGVAGIAGSTLTANALTAAVRRLMAVHEVCLAGPGSVGGAGGPAVPLR